MREMKDSGIEWVGAIPQDWQLSKIGSLYTQRNEKVSDKNYQPLSVTMQGILPQLATAAKTDDGDNRKLVRVGDFAINSRSDRRGSCGISPLDGSVSLINIILTPRTAMHPGYYNWLFHTTLFADEFYKWGHGIVADLWTTHWQEMKSITVPVPEYAEQERIAAFLDAECAEIDTVLEKTRASIEEYKKLKQAVITQVVTKGIRGDRPMKNSGIEWIGDIPAEWKVASIGRFCFVTKLAGFEFTNDMMSNIQDSGDIPIVRAQNIKMGKFINNISEFIPYRISQKLERCALNRKCLIITFIGAGIGEVAIFNEPKRYHLAPNVAKIVINVGMEHFVTEEYLLYFLMSFAGQEEINKIKKATAQPSLSMGTIRSIKMVLPDSIEEQSEIVSYLDMRCASIDALIAKKQQYLIEIENYKKSLIYEYVTGKKEVV
jgi:type I restriction enzyme S subunit